MEAQQTINIAVKGALTLPMEKLQPFQGELKRLERHEYEQLRKNIIENDFSFTIHVWENQGNYFIIDGHQRLSALTMMRDNENFFIPELPVSLVSARNYKQAKLKVLAGIAQYGKMTPKSLQAFVLENDLNWEEVVSLYKFGEFNMDKFVELFQSLEGEDLPEMLSEDLPEMQSKSDGVKQVNLVFTGNQFSEFMNKIDELSKLYGKENITDTVMEIVRENYSAKFPAK